MTSVPPATALEPLLAENPRDAELIGQLLNCPRPPMISKRPCSIKNN